MNNLIFHSLLYLKFKSKSQLALADEGKNIHKSRFRRTNLLEVFNQTFPL